MPREFLQATAMSISQVLPGSRYEIQSSDGEFRCTFQFRHPASSSCIQNKTVFGKVFAKAFKSAKVLYIALAREPDLRTIPEKI